MMLWAGDSDTDTDLGLPFHPCSVSMITLTHFHPINAVFSLTFTGLVSTTFQSLSAVGLWSTLRAHCPPWGPIAHPQWVLTFPRCSLFTQQIQPWTTSSLTGIVKCFCEYWCHYLIYWTWRIVCCLSNIWRRPPFAESLSATMIHTSFTRLTSLNIQSGEQLSSSAHPCWGWTVTTSSLLTGGYKSV